MADVLVLAVMYNTPGEALRFLDSIAAQHFDSVDVLIVDNSESAAPDFKNSLQAKWPNVLYVKSQHNLGYFGGAAEGLKFYSEKHTLPDWIIVSNVDIVFDQQDFFGRLMRTSFPPETGVVAPAIISSRWNTDTNPKIVERYTRKQMEFYKLVCTNVFTQNAYMVLSYLKKIVKGRKKTTDLPVRKKIYAPHGSCILFHKRYFECGGNLNHISFLFGEEIFVGEAAMKLGLSVLYEPSLKVSDFEHASTGFFYSKKIAGFMKESTDDILEHYYSGSEAT